MSVRTKDKRNLELVNTQENKNKTNLSNIIDNINCNNLVRFYPKDESLFKKRIDKLNLKFYIETEKYLTNKNDKETMERCQDQLFIILFKQISVYIEEIERLNFVILKEKAEDEKSTKEKIDELNRKEKEQSSNQLIINNLKLEIKNFEKKLEEKSKVEDKFRIENESLKRQIKFYKDKLQIDLACKKTHILQEKKQNSGEMNNSITSAATNGTGIRSKSRESIAKKINVNITGQVTGTLYNSNNQDKEKMNLKNDSNTNYSSSNELMVGFHNYANSNITTSNKNFNENLNLSSILNKKRNYSDNNPNQVKKHINIVSVSINNRYNDTPTNQSTFGNTISGKVNNIIENEKLLKNKFSNMKSPKKADIVFFSNVGNNSETQVKKPASDGKMMYKSLSKNPKEYNIIKSIKQVKSENQETDVQTEKQLSNRNENMKSPKSATKFINVNLDVLNSNENSLQDQILTTFNSLDEELNYLNDLERMINNTKLNFLDNLDSSNGNSENNFLNNKNSYLNNPSDSDIYKELGKRSESVENTAGHAFVLSDEEGDGYKSGTSCLSDKQYNCNIARNAQQPISNKLGGNSNLSTKNKNINNFNSKVKGNNGISGLSNVTIDLINKQKSKNNMIKVISTNKKVENYGILNKIKNK